MGCTGGKVLGDASCEAPGRQRNSPWVESGPCIGPFIPLKKESPMTTTFLFSFMEEILMQGVGCPALGDTSILGEASSMYTFPQSSFCWFSDSKASYLFYKGAWEGKSGWESHAPQAETHETHFHSTQSFLGWEGITGELGLTS